MLLTNAFGPDPRVHREASALVKNGYNVTILCWDRDLAYKQRENIDGINVVRIYLKSTHGRGVTQILFLLLFWLKAAVVGLKEKYNIVHAHDFDTLPLGYFLALFKRARLVYDAHESYVDMLLHMPHTLKRVIYLSENFFLKRADLVITVGELLKEYLVKRGAKKAVVVGNWQDPESFYFDSPELQKEKRRIGITEGQQVLSFIANLGKERQLPQLIEAVKKLPEVHLLLGGDGPCKNLVKNAARHYPNISYLGFVQPSMVPFYTALSDIVFYGFDPDNPNARFSAPNKLFEALAAGKPLITGDFGEIGNIVSHEKCGIIIANYSESQIKAALLSLKGNEKMKLSKRAKRAGREKYSWQKAGETLQSSYNYITNGVW